MDTRATTILALLEQVQPAFQLQTGTTELASSEAYFAEQGRDTSAIARASHASSDDILRYLAVTIAADWVTLETGGGRSTCVFAATARRHYCVNPDRTANQLIRQFLETHGALTADLEFLAQPSDRALPLLPQDVAIDLALIDGNHSFPIPIIDWHYIDRHLKRGGLLVVDDTQIRAVSLLTEFLATEKSYVHERTVGTTAVWRKVLDGRTWGWASQPFNRTTAWTRVMQKLQRIRQRVT